MGHRYFLYSLVGLSLLLSCNKEDVFNCDDIETLDFYLFEYIAVEIIYEDDPTGCNCLELKEAYQAYIDEAEKYPAKCVDIEPTVELLNELPCGPNSNYDDTFWRAWECSVSVPSNYNHSTQLNSFRLEAEMYPESFPQVNPSYFRDNSFSMTTDRLQPGKTYRVVLYELLRNVNMDECISFIEKEGGLFTSIQGITIAIMRNSSCIAWRNINREFHSIRYFSPDYEATMPKTVDGITLLPVVENFFEEPLFSPPYFSWNCYLFDYSAERRKGQYLLVYFNE